MAAGTPAYTAQCSRVSRISSTVQPLFNAPRTWPLSSCGHFNAVRAARVIKLRVFNGRPSRFQTPPQACSLTKSCSGWVKSVALFRARSTKASPITWRRTCSPALRLSVITLSLVETLHAHGSHATAQHIQLFGGGAGNVDQALAVVGATVVDAHDHGFVVVQIGDPYPGAERQGAVRVGQLVLVEALATGGLLAMVLGTVIGGFAALVIAAASGAPHKGRRGTGGEEGEHASSKQQTPHTCVSWLGLR